MEVIHQQTLSMIEKALLILELGIFAAINVVQTALQFAL
jgi:hypothetical protein